MAREAVAVMCYWDGLVKDGPMGVLFEGSGPNFVWLHPDMKFSEVVNKLYALMGWEKSRVKMKILGRYLARVNPDSFIKFPIVDDQSLSAMFHMFYKTQPKLTCMDIYLDKTITENDNIAGTSQTTPIGPSSHREESSIPPSNHSGDNDSDEDYDECGVAMDTIPEMVSIETRARVYRTPLFTNKDLGDEFDTNEEDESPTERQPSVQADIRMSDDEADVRKWVSSGGENPTRDDEIFVGKRFLTKGLLQEAVTKYSIKRHSQFKVIESKKTIWSLKCKNAATCKWRLRASVGSENGNFEIVKLKEPHTCVNPIVHTDHANLSAKLVMANIFEVVQKDLSINVKTIQTIIHKALKVKISYQKAWNAKQKVVARLFGSWEESYQKLPIWLQAMQDANPGTEVVWQTIPTQNPQHEIFKRVFWAFAPAIEGFKHCLPLISIDGTHLHGKYKGSLLIATAYDGNDGLFPLAFAITEGENDDSWAWFMACIREKVTQRTGLCVLSDRHIGILNAMNDEFLGWKPPNAYHRYCAKHLASSFNATFKSQKLTSLLTRAALANQPKKFDKLMEQLMPVVKDGKSVGEWLDKIPLHSWALSHDRGFRYGHTNTNLSEVFNIVLKGGMFLPITALVELTFYRCNSYAFARRQKAEAILASGALIVPKFDVIIEGQSEKANNYEVVAFNHWPGSFEVKLKAHQDGTTDKSSKVHIVDFRQRTCTCQKWMLFHYPCSHVIAVCKQMRYDVQLCVDKWFKVDEYFRSWAPEYNPIPDKVQWKPYNGPKILPNIALRRNAKGRPKSSRLHNEMDGREGGQKQTCGTCNREGHNRRKCPNKNGEGLG